MNAKQENTEVTVVDATENLRTETQEAASKFRSSWLALAKNLIKIRDEEHFQTWGFKSLNSYMQDELEFSSRVGYQLVASIEAIKRHRPRLLSDTVAKSPPSYAVVDLMERNYDKFDPDSQKKLKKLVFTDGAGRPKVAEFIKENLSGKNTTHDKSAALRKIFDRFKKIILKRIPEDNQANLLAALDSIEEYIQDAT